ncbi:methyl-accepting chemotaxis protein [Prodigiosinella confusarubida]|uniref:Methyl-accepting chemotaxis protein n=1 Tax=Serratia sp. (strain ATCC 39006) TaxID=104623 RepID=A0A2I5T758_SERS3|nr:methyl-accepting chemotaxis protein [Serratia sp. ATCC 39006]AUH00410.1 methyl-accepting chemotaxis protein [Serratia sp. ATCC 39006]AUH04730.1 methyl-accepting chemotaxis protein [Serratia sp. ATCC 39006]
MSFSNLRIGYRLAIGFFFLIFMLLIAGGVALFNMSDFNKKMDSTVSEIYPLTAKGNQLIEELNNALMGQQVILFLNSESDITRKLEEIKGHSATITTVLNDLEKSVHDKKSIDLLNEIQRIRKEYMISGNKIMELVNSGNKDEAVSELLNVALTLQSKYKSKVSEFVDYQDDQMVEAKNEVKKSYFEARLLLISVFLSSVVVGVLIAWLMTRSVTHPLQEALLIAEKVAKGDLSSEIKTERKDETGMLLRALNNMNASLRQIVSQVRDGAEMISTAASQIAAGNQDLSARTEEQASSLEETAASIEQLTSTIKNTADNTSHATSLASEASETVEKSGEMMVSVTQEMREIKDSSQRMAEIIGVIDSIAFQTNILALNAAVEAARAGEQGRGFAVVASEVRALAQRSATAAKEIKELIDDSVEKVLDGMSLVENTELTMGSVIQNVQNVNGIINEIAQASHEQSDGINQINLAVGQIDTTTQQNAALVEESAAAARSLQDQAQNLTRMVSVFKLGTFHVHYGESKYVSENNQLALVTDLPDVKGKKITEDMADWATF